MAGCPVTQEVSKPFNGLITCTPLIQHLATVCLLSGHSLLTAWPQSAYCLATVCLATVCLLFGQSVYCTVCLLPGHGLLTAWPWSAYCLATVCLLPGHSLLTAWPQYVGSKSDLQSGQSLASLSTSTYNQVKVWLVWPHQPTIWSVWLV